MPRVKTKTKNKGGKSGEYSCVRCPEPIKPGEKYHVWEFRYGGTHRQHVSHGPPRPSQLTQSKMGDAYAAVESAEDEIAAWEADTDDDGEILNLDDLASMLETAAEEIKTVADEYTESADAMDEVAQGNPVADESREKAEALEDVVTECEQKASELRQETLESGESLDDFTDRMRESAYEVFQSMP